MLNILMYNEFFFFFFEETMEKIQNGHNNEENLFHLYP